MNQAQVVQSQVIHLVKQVQAAVLHQIIPLSLVQTFKISQSIEDAGILNYELNVSDIEGDELNVTVESNNTSILSVTKGWEGLLNQADYNDHTT